MKLQALWRIAYASGFFMVSGGFLLAWMLFLNMGAGLIGNTLMLARLLRVSCSTFKASQLLSRMKKQTAKTRGVQQANTTLARCDGTVHSLITEICHLVAVALAGRHQAGV